jgi:ribonuclease P protein subunit POP4
MTSSCENILAHELVGLPAKIVESSDSSLQGLFGTIVFETKNTISFRTNSKIRKAAKQGLRRLQLQTDSGVCFISGSTLIGKPENRVSRL